MSKYQWPASRLDEEEMALLFQTKQKTQKSICELLRRAVHVAYGNKSNCVKFGDSRTKKEISDESEKKAKR